MPIANALASEVGAVVGTIDPDAYTVGSQSTDYVDLADYERVMFVLMLGDVDTTSSIAFKLQEATTSGGGGAQDISGKSITTLTSTSPNVVSNSQAIINVSAEELTINSSYRYVKAVVTMADTNSPADSPAATYDMAVIAIGINPRHGPANTNDLASVGEIA